RGKLGKTKGVRLHHLLFLIYYLLLGKNIGAILIYDTRLRGHKFTIYPVRWRLRPLRDKLSHGVNYLLLFFFVVLSALRGKQESSDSPFHLLFSICDFLFRKTKKN
ncbi:MAG: hypothetical protein WBC05_24040, partial [Sedimentisphaerales bacterium]